MHDTALATVAATGFTVAFFHAAIPTHWLPFVLVARARNWSRTKMLLVTLFAGVGHILLTTLIGLVIAWFGFQIDEKLGRAFPWLAGGLLLLIGLYYGWQQWRGTGIRHHLVPGSHHQADHLCGANDEQSHFKDELKDSKLVADGSGDWAAISGLFIMLTLSPCEGFLPVYLSGVQFGWRGFLVLSGILAVATLLGMLLFTTLTLIGMEKFKLQRFERYEAGLLGALFAGLAVVVVVLER